MNRFSIKDFIPGIAWFFIVLVLLCLPGNKPSEQLGWFDIYHIDKFIHFGLFGTMSFLFFRPILRSNLTAEGKTAYLIKIAVSISLWGITTEFIQKFFVLYRSFELLDWAADSSGALVVLLICLKKIAKP